MTLCVNYMALLYRGNICKTLHTINTCIIKLSTCKASNDICSFCRTPVCILMSLLASNNTVLLQNIFIYFIIDGILLVFFDMSILVKQIFNSINLSVWDSKSNWCLLYNKTSWKEFNANFTCQTGDLDISDFHVQIKERKYKQ